MLVSHKHKVVVMTPAKTGQTTTQQIFTKRSNFGEWLLPAQRMDAPPEAWDYKPYIIVRDPYERIRSVFHESRGNDRKGDGSPDYRSPRWANEYTGDFKTFVQYYRYSMYYDPKPLWVYPYWLHLELFQDTVEQKVEVIRLEEYQKWARTMSDTYETVPWDTHSNRTKTHKVRQFEWTEELYELVDVLVREDCKRFDYERRL